MKKIQAVFFDFDGVLIDSLPVMKKAWEFTREKYNLEPDFKEFAKYIGIPFNAILKNLGIDNKKYALIHKSYSEVARKNLNLIHLNPYVKNIIDWLKKNKIKIAIVTSKDFVRTKELIEFFNIKTDLIVTPESTLKGKPYPEPLLFAAKNLSLSIEESLFIGDMFSDMKAAQSANCKYLHYLCGYDDLKKLSYGGNINSLLEIKEYINLI